MKLSPKRDSISIPKRNAVVSHRIHAFALPCILLTLIPALVLGNEYLRIKFPEGPLPDTRIAVGQSGDLLYVDLNGFASALNIRTYVNRERKKIQYTIGSINLKWTADNAFTVIGNEIYQLPAEVIYQDHRYWAPLDAFLNIMAGIYPATITYDRYLWTLTIKPTDFDVYAIRYEPKENGTLIRISCTKKLTISQPALRQGYLSLTLMGTSVNREAIEMTPPAGVVRSVIVDTLPESVQLTFKLSKPILEHSVWQEKDPHQIVISLVTQIITPSDDLTENPVANDSLDDILEREQERWRMDCVVIDPGHGGKDTGAIGVTGQKEKDIVLAIAQRLRNLLQKNTDLKVVLTRDDDRFLALNERTQLANRVGGKLFISLHCNSTKSGRGNGAETYFLKPARNERAMEVALLENSVIRYEESRNQYQDLTEENYILLAMAQSEFARESESLAALVQNNLCMKTSLRNRGVDQAGFYVLVGASMPAVLVETAFLSDKREEKLLRTKKFQQQVAQALYEGIMEFMQREKTTNGVSVGRY